RFEKTFRGRNLGNIVACVKLHTRTGIPGAIDVASTHGAPSHRWSLLSLPLVFRHPRPHQLARRAYERHLRISEGHAQDGGGFETRSWRCSVGSWPGQPAHGSPGSI